MWLLCFSMKRTTRRALHAAVLISVISRSLEAVEALNALVRWSISLLGCCCCLLLVKTERCSETSGWGHFNRGVKRGADVQLLSNPTVDCLSDRSLESVTPERASSQTSVVMEDSHAVLCDFSAFPWPSTSWGSFQALLHRNIPTVWRCFRNLSTSWHWSRVRGVFVASLTHKQIDMCQFLSSLICLPTTSPPSCWSCSFVFMQPF